MARLPIVGGDTGNWGALLNEYLSVEHNPDGTHGTVQTLTDGANINWDLSLGAMAILTLGGDRTLENPTNMIAGESYILIIKQDDDGNHSLNFGTAYKFGNSTTPTLTTTGNAIDIIAFLCDGTNLYGSFQGNFGS